jgi:hypothetical protein
MTDLDWSAVERLRRLCYRQGYLPTPEERKLLERALRADAGRYNRIGTELRDEYKREFSGR